jgi:hypothetical protein
MQSIFVVVDPETNEVYEIRSAKESADRICSYINIMGIPDWRDSEVQEWVVDAPSDIAKRAERFDARDWRKRPWRVQRGLHGRHRTTQELGWLFLPEDRVTELRVTDVMGEARYEGVALIAEGTKEQATEKGLAMLEEAFTSREKQLGVVVG